MIDWRYNTSTCMIVLLDYKIIKLWYLLEWDQKLLRAVADQLSVRTVG